MFRIHPAAAAVCDPPGPIPMSAPTADSDVPFDARVHAGVLSYYSELQARLLACRKILDECVDMAVDGPVEPCPGLDQAMEGLDSAMNMALKEVADIVTRCESALEKPGN